MKRPFLNLGAGLVVVTLGLASTGCSQTGAKETTSKSKPADPSVWSERDLTNNATDGPSAPARSSGITGGWSSDAREIEKSLGVGQ
jgi:hypothetical protein